jgi:CDP-6-deoxy-D-xylo-4-hexulose-3-dehydrase
MKLNNAPIEKITNLLNIPLMKNNIDQEDIDCLIEFLKQSDVFTQNEKVREFEEAWSKWLGVKHSVFLNSGSSANFITMAVLKELYGVGEVLVPPLTWSSDIASVINAGFTPVFVDINLKNLAMDENKILEAITPNTVAIFLTHVLGFNGLSSFLLEELEKRNIHLIEDVCESHGASFNGKKAGTFGKASNFSFYYAHHMSTIEGGMLCVDDDKFYQYARLMRSHGMVRESTDAAFKKQIAFDNPELSEEFIFLVPGYNMRSTELNAVIGLSQLKRLNINNKKRFDNFKLFLDNLDKDRYCTDFDINGSVNYAFILILREKNQRLFNNVINRLRNENVEFRRGTAGGGNMARQPFVRKVLPTFDPTTLKNTEHVHFYGLYTGNYPGLEQEKILELCSVLNKI